MHEVEDPIEESPAPLQERSEAAAQEVAGSPKLGRSKQRKQLRKIHTANESDAGVTPYFTAIYLPSLSIFMMSVHVTAERRTSGRSDILFQLSITTSMPCSRTRASKEAAETGQESRHSYHW